MTAGLLVWIFVLVAASSLFLSLLANGCVLRVLGRRPGWTASPPPPISILKPVKGAEEGLYENLASIARQDYPRFEIVIGAEDANDPALAVARRVQRDHPGVRIQVLSGARHLGLNPKVNLLARLSERARYDHVLISDSNVRARPNYLRDTAAELGAPGVGLVTNLVVGSGEGSLGGVLESLHLNSFVAAGASLARVIGGRACVIGKSMLFRRSELHALGGFSAFCDVLAEDYVIGRRFELAGHRVALSSHPICSMNGDWTLERFANRHLRWAQMRRRLFPPAYLAELLLNPVLWISLAVASRMVAKAGPDLRVFAAAALALKCAADAAIFLRLRGEALPARNLLLIPAKDLLIACIWVVGAFRRSINWRGNVLRIGQGSRLVRPEAAQARLLPQRAA